MSLEGQPLLPAPTRSRKGLVAWLRGIPFIAIALVAVFAVGIGSHIARSDVAQNVKSSLTQRPAGVPRWGSKPVATLPAQDDAGADDEDDAEGSREPDGTAVEGSAAAAQPAVTGASQQGAAQGADSSSTASQAAGSDQQPADGAAQADAATVNQQQASGSDAGQQSAEGQPADAQPAASSDQQSSDSAQQQQTAEPAPATLEEVWDTQSVSSPGI